MEKTPDCLPYSLNIPTPFGYRPSLVAGIIFMILFLGVTIVHVWQAFRHRNIWLGLAFSLGTFGELVGWLGRTVAYRCLYSVKLLEMQLAALIMGKSSFLFFFHCQETIYNYMNSPRLHDSRHLRCPGPDDPNHRTGQVPLAAEPLPHHLYDG